MEAQETQSPQGAPPAPAAPPERQQHVDPREEQAKAAGAGEKGRELLEHAAMGATLSDGEERTALDWLLGDPVAIPHAIPVEFETPDGIQKLEFIVRKMDTSKIDSIEQKHVNASTGRLDQIAADREIVATLVDAVTAPGDPREVELTSSQFRTMRLRSKATGEVETVTLATPMEAIAARFRGQEGLLMGIAREMRRIAGYDTARIGQAQRRLTEASLG